MGGFWGGLSGQVIFIHTWSLTHIRLYFTSFTAFDPICSNFLIWSRLADSGPWDILVEIVDKDDDDDHGRTTEAGYSISSPYDPLAQVS